MGSRKNVIYQPSLFTTHIYEIELPTLTTEFSIVPFGDIHKGARNHSDSMWSSFCQHYKKKQKKEHIYYLGMADYHDLARTTVRDRIKKADIEEGLLDIIDEKAKKQVIRFTKDVEFMRGRLIGLLEGNHMWVYQDGTSTGQDLCDRLDTEYLGYTSYIHVRVRAKKQNVQMAFGLFVSHGKGSGGKLLGTSINKVDDMRAIIPNASIYLMGHDHKKIATSSAILHPSLVGDRVIMKQQEQWFGRTGGFLRGYVENEASYLVNMMLRPVPLGNLEFKLKYVDKRDSKTGDRALMLKIGCLS